MNPEKQEYELQHFNFSSDEIIEQNRFMVKTVIQQSLIEFTDEFVEANNIPIDQAMELRAKCYTTAAKMFEDCTQKLEELAALYQSTFTIPDNVLLPSDLMQKKNYTAEYVQELQQEVSSLDKQFRQDCVFLAHLEEEIKLHQHLAPFLDSETKLNELVDQYRREEIVPVEDAAVVQDLAEVMQNVLNL
ncbi:protein MIS12 homolog [Wyeomyia smithii]|uniref:protein MIS12 homolog n=1 Tax=Wyeomyia smithii TaxID=174621 RepID=UPI002467B269|nr:protein MIS12 homolog [Wyeomyia smithii]